MEITALWYVLATLVVSILATVTRILDIRVTRRGNEITSPTVQKLFDEMWRDRQSELEGLRKTVALLTIENDRLAKENLAMKKRRRGVAVGEEDD